MAAPWNSWFSRPPIMVTGTKTSLASSAVGNKQSISRHKRGARLRWTGQVCMCIGTQTNMWKWREEEKTYTHRRQNNTQRQVVSQPAAKTQTQTDKGKGNAFTHTATHTHTPCQRTDTRVCNGTLVKTVEVCGCGSSANTCPDNCRQLLFTRHSFEPNSLQNIRSSQLHTLTDNENTLTHTEKLPEITRECTAEKAPGGRETVPPARGSSRRVRCAAIFGGFLPPNDDQRHSTVKYTRNAPDTGQFTPQNGGMHELGWSRCDKEDCPPTTVGSCVRLHRFSAVFVSCGMFHFISVDVLRFWWRGASININLE